MNVLQYSIITINYRVKTTIKYKDRLKDGCYTDE